MVSTKRIIHHNRTAEILDIFAEVGADIIEVGVPFSDPMADGDVIQKAMERALKNKTTIKEILAVVKNFKDKHNIPVILMGYYNTFFQYNFECFAKDAADSGVDGVLTIDMPPEESKEMRLALNKNGIVAIFLATPVTDKIRLKVIKKVAKGFIYFVSVTGVTGEREGIPNELKGKIEEIKDEIRLPVVVGFGISNPDTIIRAYHMADGFVVGSAIVRRWYDMLTGEIPSDDFLHFLKGLSSCCHGNFIGSMVYRDLYL